MTEPTPETIDPFAPPTEAGTAAPARRGRTVLWVAVAAVVSLLAGLAIGTATTAVYENRDDISTAINEAAVAEGTLTFEDVAPGDCFDEKLDEDSVILALNAVPCTEPHDAQAYWTFSLDGAEAYPGDDEVDDAAGETCAIEYAKNAALEKATATSQRSWYTPGELTWEEDGDRKAICIVTAPRGKLTAAIPVVVART